MITRKKFLFDIRFVAIFLLFLVLQGHCKRCNDSGDTPHLFTHKTRDYGFCFNVFPGVTLDMHESWEYCLNWQPDGNMVSIHDVTEMEYLSTLILPNTWIGFVKGDYLTEDPYSPSRYFWTDGSTVDYISPLIAEDEGGLCFRQSPTNIWADRTCIQNAYPVACRYPLNVCFGILESEEMVCSSSGECVGNDICNCTDDHCGVMCEEIADYHCNSIACNDENVCSQRGACARATGCICYDGYSGSNCENVQRKCDDVDFDVPSVCSGHGACYASENCSCDIGYNGRYCQTTAECFAIPSTSEEVCSEHGICQSTDVCLCDRGYGGPDCSNCNLHCFDECFETACNNHGTCWANGADRFCACDQNVTGLECDAFQCYGLLNTDVAVCSGMGVCENVNDCRCDPLKCSDGCAVNETGKCEWIKCPKFWDGDNCTSCSLSSLNFDQEVCDGSTCSGFFKGTSCLECDLPPEFDWNSCDGVTCKGNWIPPKCEICKEYFTNEENNNCLSCAGEVIEGNCMQSNASISTGYNLVWIPIVAAVTGFVVVVLVVIVVINMVVILRKRSRLGKKQEKTVDDINMIGKLGRISSIELQKKEIMEKSIDEVWGRIKNNAKLPLLKEEEVTFLRLLGAGGSRTQVFACKWNNNDVAIKVFDLMVDFGESQLKEFYREIELMQNLFHPNIIRFFGVLNVRTQIGFAMEYCPFGDVRKFLKNNPKITQIERFELLAQIANGMCYLHSRTVIHRDLKLENVLIGKDKVCKIMDFGLSRSFERVMSRRKTTMIGTPLYMAPEMTLSLDYSNKVDVFSYGIIIFEVSTGNFKPFGEVNDNYLYVKIANNPEMRPRFPKDCEVPEWIQGIATRSWNHYPEDRPTFHEIFTMLELHLTVMKKASIRVRVVQKDVNEEGEDYERCSVQSLSIRGITKGIRKMLKSSKRIESLHVLLNNEVTPLNKEGNNNKEILRKNPNAIVIVKFSDKKVEAGVDNDERGVSLHHGILGDCEYSIAVGKDFLRIGIALMVDYGDIVNLQKEKCVEDDHHEGMQRCTITLKNGSSVQLYFGDDKEEKFFQDLVNRISEKGVIDVHTGIFKKCECKIILTDNEIKIGDKKTVDFEDIENITTKTQKKKNPEDDNEAELTDVAIVLENGENFVLSFEKDQLVFVQNLSRKIEELEDEEEGETSSGEYETETDTENGQEEDEDGESS